MRYRRGLRDGADGAAISDVAATLGLSRSTVHGLLQTMREVGFVYQPARNGRYAVSPYPPGSRIAPIDPNLLRSAAMSWADGLADRSGQSVHIAMLGRDRAVIVHHVLRPDGISQTMESGSELPLHATALGKILVAYRPGIRQEATGCTREAFTARTLTAPAVLARELALVRSRGWAAEIGEFRLDRASIAAPIRLPNRSVVAAISVTGPVEEIASPAGQSSLVPRVRLAAADIEHTLKGTYGATVCHVVGTGHLP
ncbi:IclR family transcriptional regulator [Nocardia sp. NPDC088792]|uniref:IclR family transcriptional regulator n=1 Tax=Nocardia sp. NPDC088792 TaxID=3364332 RepID=UPI00382DCCE8